jgi:regulator of replication initiation timing
MDVEKLMEETARHYEGKMDKLFQTIEQLKSRCVKLQNENRGLRKSNDQLIREKKKAKQHYKNGKRGTKFNG